MKITVPQRELFHWRRTRHGKREVAVCRRITIATVLTIGMSTTAVAAPTGGVVTAGAGAITQTGAVTDISQSSQRLDIDWNDFSIAAGETVNFAQPDNLAVAINRVVGGVPSELSGALNANGRIFILNQAGVVFHQTAQVNVGALLATTASDVSVSALLDGEQYSFSGADHGSVVNHGTITVSDGGFAILAAPQVHNTATIQADLGEIHLAATTAYTLDLRGDGLINFAIPADAAHNVVGGVQAGGTLRARSGLVSLDARTATELVNGVVNLDGVIDADALVHGGQGGSVMLAATGDIAMGENAAIHVNHGATGEITLSAGGNVDAGRLAVSASGTDVISASVSAQAGGHLNVQGIAVSALSNDNPSATVSLHAGGDIHVTEGISATAVGSTDQNQAPYAAADISAHSEGGDITIEGDTLAVATANGVEGSYEFGTAEAHATVDYSAAHALTTHGNVTLRTTSYFGGERGDSESHTYLTLHSRDSGDITLNGDITIDSLATRNVYRSAEAVVNADISAANNIVINGGIGMSNTALAIAKGRSGYYTDGACMASADTTLNMHAGTAGRGDLVITDGLDVTGYASLHFGGTHSANAYITADLKAADDIVISGTSDAITLSAIGHNTAQWATKTFADIDVDMAAGTAGAGSVQLNGNFIAEADALLTDGKFTNGAATLVDIATPDNLLIDGDVRVSAVLDAVTQRRYSYADSRFTAAAGTDGSGSLTITGDTEVIMEATTYGSIEGGHTTTALAQLSAPGDIHLGGLSVSALGDYSPGSGSDADVDAHLRVNSWADGDIILDGDLLVTANAVQRVANNADADAQAHLNAARHLTVTGDVTVSADAVSSETAADALSSAVLGMQAGTAGSGHLHVTGDMQVHATTTKGTGIETANAAMTLTAADDLTVHGADPLVHAASTEVQGSGPTGVASVVVDDDGTNQASLGFSAGGTLTVEIPPPPPEPEPDPEPEIESAPESDADQNLDDTPSPTPVDDSDLAERHHDAPASDDIVAQHPRPVEPASGSSARGHDKVAVSVISAFNSATGPRNHTISVSKQAVEHGAMGKSSPAPLDSVVFEIDWDSVATPGEPLDPVSTLHAPLNDDGLGADKGERKRR